MPFENRQLNNRPQLSFYFPIVLFSIAQLLCQNLFLQILADTPEHKKHPFLPFFSNSQKKMKENRSENCLYI